MKFDPKEYANWLVSRGVPLDKLTCPMCQNTVIKRAMSPAFMPNRRAVIWAPSSSADAAPEFECNEFPGHSRGPQAGPLQIPPDGPPTVIIRACP